jgi:hypothetical protein
MPVIEPTGTDMPMMELAIPISLTGNH